MQNQGNCWVKGVSSLGGQPRLPRSPSGTGAPVTSPAAAAAAVASWSNARGDLP